MLNVNKFREYVVAPALEALDLYSLAAEELLVGTAIQESRLTYCCQLGNGPALGLFQMEPATHTDIWGNYLAWRPVLREKVLRLCAANGPVPGFFQRDAINLALNAWYAAAMCRVHYLRRPEPLPPSGDIESQAAYWKKFYNTPMGAGTESEYIEAWHAAIDVD